MTDQDRHPTYADLKQRVAELEAGKPALSMVAQRDADSAKEMRDRLRRAETEAASGEAALTELREGNAALTDALLEAQDECRALNIENDALRDTIRSLQDERAALRRQVEAKPTLLERAVGWAIARVS